MAGIFCVFSLLILGSFPLVWTRKCPCENPSYCETIDKPQGKEFLMFSTKPNVWRKYDWEKVTTIALFRPWDDELMCEAHKRGVRVVLSAAFPTDKLSNKELRTKWVKNLTQQAVTLFADGLNIDIEEPIAKGSQEVSLLTELVNETAYAFHAAIKSSQVSFDVAWSPDCVDGRCYDAKGLSLVADFLVVMAYDEQSQMRTRDCIARANTPINQTINALGKYFSLGIKPEKLVLGLPWYGYDYPCLGIQDKICTIQRVPFRGVNCSDAAGREIPYSKIQDLIISRALFSPIRDPDSESFFFNYETSLGVVHQVWFDNPISLALKYKIAANEGLTGVAIWNSDQLDFSDLARAKRDTQDMWNALQH